MNPLPIALAGIGKIARDEHIPALTASPDFQLVGVVTRQAPSTLQPAPYGVPAFSSIADMKAALPDLAAVSVCTPPRGRLALIRQAFDHGLDVMVEKPPAATVSEARALVDLAARSARVLFVTWHARYAAAVEPARSWLSGRRIHAVRVTWKEDVRVWHPDQEWIWEPGLGVFDPGINALSVLSRILPGPLMVEASTLRFPADKQAPVAATLELVSTAGAPVTMELDFDHPAAPVWDIEVDTDAGRLTLSMGGARLAVEGRAVEAPGFGEYPGLYRRFAELLTLRESEVDLTPFELMADSFMLARRESAPALEGL